MTLVSLPRSNCLQAVDVFVLAGGLGTRIQPVLGDVPKLLAPIRGRTYLSYLLDWLHHFGARRVVLGLGHQAQAITRYLQEYPPVKLEIETVIEPKPLGTAGAIRFARPELHSDPVLILNGDSLADTDLCGFLTRYRTIGARGAILCTEVDNAGRYGRVLLDDQGIITGFVEKDPAFPGRAMINTGIYLISADLLDFIADGKAVSLERDVFERLPTGSLAAFTECYKFIDIGTPELLTLANHIFGAHN